MITSGKKAQRVFEKQPCSICASSNASEIKFSCASSGTSPLAGTTYVYKEDLPNCWGTLYVCKYGCSSRVPNELIDDMYEGGNCNSEEINQ